MAISGTAEINYETLAKAELKLYLKCHYAFRISQCKQILLEKQTFMTLKTLNNNAVEGLNNQRNVTKLFITYKYCKWK